MAVPPAALAAPMAAAAPPATERTAAADGDMDVVSGRKSGLFLAENLAKTVAAVGK